jgi:hypothetical protein
MKPQEWFEVAEVHNISRDRGMLEITMTGYDQEGAFSELTLRFTTQTFPAALMRSETAGAPAPQRSIPVDGLEP